MQDAPLAAQQYGVGESSGTGAALQIQIRAAGRGVDGWAHIILISFITHTTTCVYVHVQKMQIYSP